jgi:hypothetical protein
VGKGKSAEWIGSIAWDGYRSAIPAQVLNCESEEAFRHAVTQFIASREDGTKPEQGWPWPWETSATTDCHYWFFDGLCWEGCGDHSDGGTEKWVPANEPEPDFTDCDEDSERAIYLKWFKDREPVEFPDMSKMKQREKFGAHSGVMVFMAK